MPLCKQWKQCKNFSGCASSISDDISSLIGIIPSDQPNNFWKWTQTFSDFYYSILFNCIVSGFSSIESIDSIPRYTMIRDVVEKASRIGPIQVTYPLGQKCRITLDLLFPGKSQQSGFFDIFKLLKNYEIHSYLVFVNFVKSTPKGKSMIVTTFVPFQANHYSFIFAGLSTSTASLSSKKRRVDPFVLVRQRSIAIKPFFFK